MKIWYLKLANYVLRMTLLFHILFTKYKIESCFPYICKLHKYAHEIMKNESFQFGVVNVEFEKWEKKGKLGEDRPLKIKIISPNGM